MTKAEKIEMITKDIENMRARKAVYVQQFMAGDTSAELYINTVSNKIEEAFSLMTLLKMQINKD